MNSRDAILASLRRNAPPVAPLPKAPTGITYADPERQFAEAFGSVGGRFVRVASLAEVNTELGKFESYAQARRIASLVPDIGRANVDLAALKDPHQLEGIDVAIIAGEFGVAENGAVWVPGSTLGPHRAIFVVTQHLVLVVPAGQIVHNMHQAYDRIRLERPGFGIFISGAFQDRRHRAGTRYRSARRPQLFAFPSWLASNMTRSSRSRLQASTQGYGHEGDILRYVFFHSIALA